MVSFNLENGSLGCDGLGRAMIEFMAWTSSSLLGKFGISSGRVNLLLSISRTQISACSSKDRFADKPMMYVTGASIKSRDVAGTMGT